MLFDLLFCDGFLFASCDSGYITSVTEVTAFFLCMFSMLSAWSPIFTMIRDGLDCVFLKKTKVCFHMFILRASNQK